MEESLGLKGSSCKLTSPQRQLLSMGRAGSQEKSWRETTAQSALRFLLAARAAAFGVLGDAGGIPAGAQTEMQSRCLALLLRLAPAAPKALGALAWLSLGSSWAGNFAQFDGIQQSGLLPGRC